MTLLKEALAIKKGTIELRRDFHRHPELGFQEERTAAIVAKTLTDLGLDVTTGVAKTGVIGLLRGTSASPVLMLRFDMDALPITEETGAPYASEEPGKMHACGHDSHVAVGLSVARLLSARRDQIQGTVKFVFQPAEEGDGGAMHMVAEGVMEEPNPDYVLGMHVWNEMPVGWYSLTPGPMMAGAEIFSVTITGKGGHGASPHQSVDPIVAAAQIVNALQTITARNVNPLESAVVSVCKLDAGTAFNIIPQTARLSGTIRTFKPDVYQTVETRFKEIVENVASAMDCQAEIDLLRVTFPVDNDPEMINAMTDVVKDFDPEARIDHDHQTMGSEDFSLFIKDTPGCFVMVGSANPEKGLDFGHHHPKFDIDEDCLPFAVAIMAQGALEILKRNPHGA